MNWKVTILPKAEKDLAWFRQHKKNCYIKCFDLIREKRLDIQGIV